VLIRQKTVLALLSRANKPLSPIVFVKLAFLLRQETDVGKDCAFYDFVPYKYGPFSFALYRELSKLRHDGYVTPNENQIALCEQTVGLTEEKIDELPVTFQAAIDKVFTRHGRKSQSDLVNDVYARYPWYATKSEFTALRPKSSVRAKKAGPAVYTAGYEGKSVDAFFDYLLRKGIRLIVDVRANPVSRHYGFSKRQLSAIAQRLELSYCHMPNLGIPSKYRGNLTGFDSYQRLLKKYEQEMLPQLAHEIDDVGKLMRETPTVLVCVEKDFLRCHRSRLADAVSRQTGLDVKHI
jgi:uncharacterized protein (DUF488 family)